ncbi:MAG: YkgJ family cysteine cluster protein [Desulfosarcina sp.]
MSVKERLFLTVDEALEAVRIALAQYPFRLNLFSILWPMVFGAGAYLLQQGRGRTLWTKIPGETRLILSSEDNLKARIAEQLQRSRSTPAQLADICSTVFGAPVEFGPGPDAAPGVWIDTGMAGFVCVRCGHCCRTLNYRDGCTAADFQRWRDLGRSDIIDWVSIVRDKGRIVAYRIWIEPGTNHYADQCPWLQPSGTDGRAVCKIHDVRPMVCRQYPGSRYHARMTGCRGV